jgi:hypothetical protein
MWYSTPTQFAKAAPKCRQAEARDEVRILARQHRRQVVFDIDQRARRAARGPALADPEQARVGLDEHQHHALLGPAGTWVPQIAAHLALDQPGRHFGDLHGGRSVWHGAGMIAMVPIEAKKRATGNPEGTDALGALPR